MGGGKGCLPEWSRQSQGMISVHCFELPPLGTNAYLLIHQGLREAVVIDAPLAVAEAVTGPLRAASARLVGLWLTHGHFDHILGCAELAASGDAAKIPVLAHPSDAALLSRPQSQLDLFQMPLTMSPVAVDEWVAAGPRAIWGETVEIRHVPGHSPGSVIFYWPSLRAAFVGDTVFAGSIGRTDLPSGNHQALLDAIQREIYTLPDDTVLYPGHGPETSVGTEATGNPYVRRRPQPQN